ncbi:hypothetical protein ALC56_10057, partial [Trachymyrmex septentrionalis]
ARLIAKLAGKASKEFRQQQAEEGRLLRSKANYFIPTCRLPRTRDMYLALGTSVKSIIYYTKIYRRIQNWQYNVLKMMSHKVVATMQNMGCRSYLRSTTYFGAREIRRLNKFHTGILLSNHSYTLFFSEIFCMVLILKDFIIDKSALQDFNFDLDKTDLPSTKIKVLYKNMITYSIFIIIDIRAVFRENSATMKFSVSVS